MPLGTAEGQSLAQAATIGTPATTRIVWPPAPEQARIAYSSVLASDLDLKKGGGALGGFARFLGGTPKTGVAIQRPHDTVADSRGRVYVTEGVPTTVRLFDPATRTSRVIGAVGAYRLSKPMGLGVDNHDNLYVADQGAKRVLVYGPSGDYMRSYGDAGTFINPVDVAVDTTAGLVYVADAFQHQVLVFGLADGKLLRRLGKSVATAKAKRAAAEASLTASHGAAPRDSAAGPRDKAPTRAIGNLDIEENRGVEPGQFRYPAFVAVAPNGTLYVTDGLNARVEAFDRSGKFIREIGRRGDGPGSFSRPKGVAVDTEGHVYVVDAAFGNVQIFDEQGQILMAFSSGGRGAGDLLMPSGISIDRQDHIYVADRINDRVQVFTFLRTGAGRSDRPESRR